VAHLDLHVTLQDAITRTDDLDVVAPRGQAQALQPAGPTELTVDVDGRVARRYVQAQGSTVRSRILIPDGFRILVLAVSSAIAIPLSVAVGVRRRPGRTDLVFGGIFPGATDHVVMDLDGVVQGNVKTDLVGPIPLELQRDLVTPRGQVQALEEPVEVVDD